jgi:ribosomal protein S24E
MCIVLPKMNTLMIQKSPSKLFLIQKEVMIVLDVSKNTVKKELIKAFGRSKGRFSVESISKHFGISVDKIRQKIN